MKKDSCGGLLYTIKNNRVFLVLGKEYDDWFPFKGMREKDESPEEAAAREIYEETYGVVDLHPKDIRLNCRYSTTRKQYHIALIYIHYSAIESFESQKKKMQEKKFQEKSKINIFPLDSIENMKLHFVTYTPVRFYWIELKKIEFYLQIVHLYSCKIAMHINTYPNLLEEDYHHQSSSDTRSMIKEYPSMSSLESALSRCDLQAACP